MPSQSPEDGLETWAISEGNGSLKFKIIKPKKHLQRQMKKDFKVAKKQTRLNRRERENSIKDELEASIIYNVKGYRTDEDEMILKKLALVHSDQLPDMGLELIEKNIFQKGYRNILLLQKECREVVVGGILFNIIKERKVCTLDLMSIRTEDQVKGFGSFLFQEFVNHVQERGVKQIVVNADDYAVGFYQKQGFKAGQTLLNPGEVVKYLGDYTGCKIMSLRISKLR